MPQNSSRVQSGEHATGAVSWARRRARGVSADTQVVVVMATRAAIRSAKVFVFMMAEILACYQMSVVCERFWKGWFYDEEDSDLPLSMADLVKC